MSRRMKVEAGTVKGCLPNLNPNPLRPNAMASHPNPFSGIHCKLLTINRKCVQPHPQPQKVISTKRTHYFRPKIICNKLPINTMRLKQSQMGYLRKCVQAHTLLQNVDARRLSPAPNQHKYQAGDSPFPLRAPVQIILSLILNRLQPLGRARPGFGLAPVGAYGHPAANSK
jgi:hypothetical protein